MSNIKIFKISSYIEYSKISENEYILANLKHKHYLKINSETFNLLSLIDGKKNMVEVCKEFNLIFKENITVKQLEKFLNENLSAYGVIDGNEDKIKPYEKPSYLKLSFIIFNENIVSRVVNYFKLLFNFKVALFVVLASISTIVLLIKIHFDLYTNINLRESLILFFCITAISVTFHELGHAAAANYFGARHGGIGGGFYLFTPVYFADVTDIWRLKKWQRIVVNLSGIYFEFIFCTILSIIGVILNDTLLTIISLTVCFKTLLNLNPFLRSDGYWIISDLIEKPNLLFHSFQKIRDVLRILFGKKIKWSRIDFFLFIYGIIYLSSISFFLFYVLFQSTNSILTFPSNALNFFYDLFDTNNKITLEQYGNLIIPILFYYLCFNFLKASFKRILKTSAKYKFASLSIFK